MAKEYKSFSMELAGRTLRVEVGHVVTYKMEAISYVIW